MTPYSGVGDCISTIARQEGWRGFFKGFVPNMMKVAPSAGLSYYTFDYLQKALAGEAR
jgi:solute carrier family 25 phosphate transporter 23/24/25/41